MTAGAADAALDRLGKVGILIETLQVGGVEKTAIQEVRHLARHGVECLLLVLRRQREVPHVFEELLAGVQVEYLDDRLPRPVRASFRIPFFSYFSLFHLTYPLLLSLRLRHGEFGVVVSHNSYTTFSAWAFSRWRGIPYVMFVWDPMAYILGKAYRAGPIAWMRPILGRLAGLGDRALIEGSRGVALGSDSHLDLVRKDNASSVPVEVIPPGCEIPAGVPDHREDYLLTVTGWKPGKQLETLLEVLAEVGAGSLVVAGKWLSEDYRGEIDRMVAELGLGERVRIAGEVGEEELQRLFQGARLCITPNAELGFGMPSLEAAANGCPFACPPTAGVAAYFADQTEALYFEEGDRKAMRGIIELVLADERLAYEMGRRARRRAIDSLSWDAHASKLAALLARAVGKPIAS